MSQNEVDQLAGSFEFHFEQLDGSEYFLINLYTSFQIAYVASFEVVISSSSAIIRW